MTPRSRTIAVAGASGAIGRRAAEAFARAGWTVRRHDRRRDLAETARGAELIFNGMNPPMYRNWPVEIPRITAGVIAAARATGAGILMPGNLYVYGDQPGPWTESTPHRPASRKGAVRVQMERDLRAAAADGVPVAILRAGDFIDAPNPQTLMNMIVLKRARAGVVTATGAPASRRAYAHLPDLARAFVALAGRRAEFPGFVEFGFPGLTLSFEEIARHAAEAAGRPMRIARFPWWAVRMASPVWRLGRELSEMRYIHEIDHRIDGSAFERAFPDFAQAPAAAVIGAHLDAHLDPEASVEREVHPHQPVA